MSATQPTGQPHFLSRRQALTSFACLSLAGCVPLIDKKDAQVGLQLYSVRDLMSADPDATLKGIAEIGYSMVEPYNLDLDKAQALKTRLTRYNLKSPSVHFDLEQIDDDLSGVIAIAKTLQAHYAVVPWLAPEIRTSMTKYRAVFQTLEKQGKELKKNGLQLAYHNHDFEFLDVEGEIPFDALLEETDPEFVKIEFDTYWLAVAGRDPLALFQQYPDRFPLTHFKDRAVNGSMADVGQGTLDFVSIMDAKKASGLKHIYVERDDLPAPYWTHLKASYQSVNRLATLSGY